MANSSPRLTAVIANYNHGHFIARALEGMVSQSRQPDELLVLDDGSEDNSVLIINEFVARYPFIRLLRHQENQGALVAMNHLVEQATGDYLYSGAADDCVTSDFFSSAMFMAEKHPHAGIIFGEVKQLDPTGREVHVTRVKSWKQELFAPPDIFRTEYLENENPMHSLSAATMYRRSALVEIGGFRAELEGWCDSFGIRAIGLKYGACYLPFVCAAWNLQLDSYSQVRSHSPTRLLAIADRARDLMLSEEFSDRFPAAHVASWHHSYRQEIIRTYLERFKAGYSLPREVLNQGLTGESLASRIARNLFRWSTRAEAKLWATGLGFILSRQNPSRKPPDN